MGLADFWKRLTGAPAAPAAPLATGIPVVPIGTRQLVTAQLLQDCGIQPAIAAQWAGPLNDGCIRAEINTPARLAAFLANAMTETGNFTATSKPENLNYSAKGLAETWPNRFAINPHAPKKERMPNPRAQDLAAMTPREAKEYAIGEAVYSGRMGNTQPGMGYKFRGRTPLQLTGRDNYAEMEQLTGLPLLSDPDVACTVKGGALIAAIFWKRYAFNRFADAGTPEKARAQNATGNPDFAPDQVLGMDTFRAIHRRILPIIQRALA